jgi:transmembrane 9 superfamily protein 2/4
MAGLMARAAPLALALLAAPPAAVAFYLPGVAPRQYAAGEEVQLKVNRMTSQRTQLPYNFYDLPFCQAMGGVVDSAENLGEILTGNVIENSAYTFNMYTTVTCGVVCVKTFTDAEAAHFVGKIDEQYIINMIMDNLPAAYKTVSDSGTETLFYSHGYPLGGVVVTQDGVKLLRFLNNHLAFVVQYHVPDFELDKKAKAEAAGEVSFGRAPARIVGLLVEPFSVKHEYDAKSNSVKFCPTELGGVAQVKFGQSIDKGTEVVFTYSVQWQESSVKWAYGGVRGAHRRHRRGSAGSLAGSAPVS